MGEQPNPLYQLQHKEMTSRHRGDKVKCRFERLILIILLSLWFLLFVNQK